MSVAPGLREADSPRNFAAAAVRLPFPGGSHYKTSSMSAAPALRYRHRHLLGIQGLSREEIVALLDLSETYVAFNRGAVKKRDLLAGRTLINLFFENSTRTRTSFELAGKRLGGDVINMQAASSSIKKGETLIDTAMTLNAMHPDVLVVRHPESGAAVAGWRDSRSRSAATSCIAASPARTSSS